MNKIKYECYCYYYEGVPKGSLCHTVSVTMSVIIAPQKLSLSLSK